MNWTQIPPYGIRDLVGPFVKPILERAVMRDPHGWTTQAVIERCASGHMQLWCIGEIGKPPSAVVVTDIEERPTGKVLRVPYLAGRDMTEWFDLHQLLEEFAAAEDCAAVEIIGRDGWERKLRGFGYSKRAVIVRKELPRAVSMQRSAG